MDRAVIACERSRPVARAIAASTVPDAEAALIQVLRFWIPAALALWSAVVWTVLRLV
jgi:hypothetical protein